MSHPVQRPAAWTDGPSCSAARTAGAPQSRIFTQPISFIGLPVAAVPVAGPMRSACRSSRALAGRHRAAHTPPSRTSGAAVAQRPEAVDIDLPEIRAEVEAAFARYEAALTGNDVAALTHWFWTGAQTIRYGIARTSTAPPRSPPPRRPLPAGLARTLSDATPDHHYGRDMAVAATLFHRGNRLGQDRRQCRPGYACPKLAHRRSPCEPGRPHPCEKEGQGSAWTRQRPAAFGTDT